MCGEVKAAAVSLVLAVRVDGAGGLVDGLVDDVVLQLRRSGRGAVFHPFPFTKLMCTLYSQLGGEPCVCNEFVGINI